MRKLFVILLVVCPVILCAEVKFQISGIVPINSNGDIDTGRWAEKYFTGTLDRGKLYLNGNVYELFSEFKKESRKGFKVIKVFLASDKYGQLCHIGFHTDTSADWPYQYYIIVDYIDDDEALIFISNDPFE